MFIYLFIYLFFVYFITSVISLSYVSFCKFLLLNTSEDVNMHFVVSYGHVEIMHCVFHL